MDAVKGRIVNALLSLPVIDGPIPPILYGLAIAFLVVILVRRYTKRGAIATIVGFVAGAAAGVGVFFWANLTNAFGGQLPKDVALWAAATFGAIVVALVSLWGTRWWRKIVAILGVVVFVAAGAIGINAAFGLNPRLADMFGIVVDTPIDLPAVPAPGSSTSTGPVYATWKAPAGMPAVGTRGTAKIPATVSGFNARPAGLYLPPAALVPNAPALPLVIMMMGYPGNPDPTKISDVLDQFAASHNGLAPIVIIADQIGTGKDPACADSKTYGNAATYIKTDVVNWAKANLHISANPKDWVIAGYSNGGGCALKYGVQEPKTFGNIFDISGEPFPGSEIVDRITKEVYGGSAAAFNAAKPLTIMAAAPKGTFAGMHAVLTIGSDDSEFGQSAREVAAATKAAGMTTTLSVIPGAGHVGSALSGGLTAGFTILYPVLGLAAP